MSQLVGIAIEKIFLEGLQSDGVIPGLPGTVGERKGKLDAARSDIQTRTGAFADWFPDASETDLENYLDRVKADGESSAMRWISVQGGRVQ